MSTEQSPGRPLPCPRCGEESAAITVNMADPLCDSSLQCLECEEYFSVAEIEAIARRWAPVLAWLKSCPGEGDE